MFIINNNQVLYLCNKYLLYAILAPLGNLCAKVHLVVKIRPFYF